MKQPQGDSDSLSGQPQVFSRANRNYQSLPKHALTSRRGSFRCVHSIGLSLCTINFNLSGFLTVQSLTTIALNSSILEYIILIFVTSLNSRA